MIFTRKCAFCLKRIFHIRFFSNEMRHLMASKNVKHNVMKNNVEKMSHFTSQSVRESFIKYFVENHSHTFIKSSSVLPHNDTSLLYVNAGMNQFKPIFLNKLPPNHETRELKRAVNSQKCIRAGGKHCDLESVGRDLTHHTFFEMLGNWSFGDYHKKEACQMAWDLLTEVFKLDSNRLIVTYFGGNENMKIPPDYETKEIWQNIGVPLWKIIPMDSKDNFWEMGDDGPCGVCTEIHYLTEPIESKNAKQLIKNCIEIWNIVFIQYNKSLNGELQTLPNHYVDTGMGLERILSILQGVNSAYETDLFIPLFNEIQNICQIKRYSNSLTDSIDIGYRTVADHSRMMTVAIGDGLIPNDVDAAHILRKIIRKASSIVMHDFHISSPSELLCSLSRITAETLGHAYPELRENLDFILTNIDKEICEYEHTIGKIEKYFHIKVSDVLKNESKKFPSAYAFDLINIFGANKTLISSLLNKYDMTLDWEEMEKLESEKFIKDHESRQKIIKHNDLLKFAETLRVSGIVETDDSYKYDFNLLSSFKSRIIAIIKENQFINECIENDDCLIVTEKTNFYSDAGGQRSDTGFITTNSGKLLVRDVRKADDYVFHRGTVINGNILLNDHCLLNVNQFLRRKCMQNHTASHILDSALQNVLLSSSPVLYSPRVTGEYIRFEYTGNSPLNSQQIIEIEDYVNNAIRSDFSVKRKIVPLNDRDSDVCVIPGEEYPDPITIVFIEDNSGNCVNKTACCGTHVQSLGEIESLTIIQQESVGLNKRVIRTLTGLKSLSSINRGEKLIENLSIINEQFNQLKVKDNINNNELHSLKQNIYDIKKNLLMDSEIPLRVRLLLNKELERIKNEMEFLIENRKELSNKIIDQLNEEFIEINKNNEAFVVHNIKTESDLKTAFKIGLDHCGHRPCALFYKDLVENEIYCQFSVPKDFQKYLNANDWFESVSDLLTEKTIITDKKRHKLLFVKIKCHHLDYVMNRTHDYAKNKVNVN